MIHKRLEILKGSEWIEVEFYYGQGIKYNNVINKIANTTERSLSHSNTFEIPWTKQNIDALDLNVFNATDLANSLNEKYEARYYIDNELTQQGFIVINNMDGGIPSLNFIDGALSLIEQWGSTTYKEFIQDDTLLLNVSTAYVTAINTMKSYSMSKTTVLTALGNISGESFPIAYFPNNINTIGEKFGVNQNDVRTLDQFNPYQSRPLFNAQAFLNMVTEAYGYNLIENASIDWTKMAITAICDDGLAKGEKDAEGSSSTSVWPEVALSDFHFEQVANNSTGAIMTQVAMRFPTSVGITPNSVTNFPSYPTSVRGTASIFRSNRTLFVPDVSAGNVGTINFTGVVENNYGGNGTYDGTFIVYEDTTTTNGYIIEEAIASANNNTTSTVDWTMDKSQFDSPTSANAGSVIGIYLLREDVGTQSGTGRMTDMVVTESVLASGVVSFDDYGQYLQDSVDLTFATPSKTIKKIINGILQRFGALIEIDHINKKVEIFSYESYKTSRDAGSYVDWTDYYQEYSSPNFNTNYGNEYAIKNKLGLGSPYLGNTVERYLGNQVTNSKLKEFAKNYNTEFNDVTLLIVVNNTVPYNEFSIGGASMVEFDYLSGDLTQGRYDTANGTSGTITAIPFMTNVNFSVIPDGLESWYNLIDKSIRCKPTFLIPQNEIRNLDIKLPIYIGKLGGFYIPEEIEQYEDETIPAKVKLIKLI